MNNTDNRSSYIFQGILFLPYKDSFYSCLTIQAEQDGNTVMIYRTAVLLILFIISCRTLEQRVERRKTIFVLSEAEKYKYHKISLFNNQSVTMPDAFVKETGMDSDENAPVWSEKGANEISMRVSSAAFLYSSAEKNPDSMYSKAPEQFSVLTFNYPGGRKKSWWATEDEAMFYNYLKKNNALKLDVMWGPSQPEIQTEMFKFAQIKSSDIVYDLGCGDGRVLVQAAKQFGAKGIGYDLDPDKIAAAEKLAKANKVENLVSFKNANMFDQQIGEATVITLYLNISVNARLRPKLFQELQPGTRIVSHNWHMGEWKADGVKSVGKRIVFYWLLPADFSGEWTGSTKNFGDIKVNLTQKFQMVTGEVSLNGKSYAVKDSKVKGKTLALNLEKGLDITLHSDSEILSITSQGKDSSEKITRTSKGSGKIY